MRAHRPCTPNLRQGPLANLVVDVLKVRAEEAVQHELGLKGVGKKKHETSTRPAAGESLTRASLASATDLELLQQRKALGIL